MTRQRQHGYQGEDELASGPRLQPTQEDWAFQQSNGEGTPFPANPTEAHSELGPAFQLGDRVWYLSIEPAEVCLVKVVRTWT